MAIRSELSSPTGSDASSSSDDAVRLLIELSSSENIAPLPTLPWDKIRVGRTLGKGSFSKVKAVRIRTKTKRNNKYAVKFLRNVTIGRKDISQEAMMDLSIEAQLLSHLNHENIVQIHAQGCLPDSYTDDCRYFLVLDRLDNTLDWLMEEWRLEDLPYSMGPDNIKKPPLVDRIQSIALPVARAMEYLHSSNIVFRDLKPLNIGFQDGTVKLFDFGLARFMKQDVKLTGRVGSPLYMAPEVLLSQDYGLSADVFSYAMVLWELVTVDIPFEGFNKRELVKVVVEENQRPGLDRSNCKSPQLRDLISSGWSRSPESRPTFSTICSVLKDKVLIEDEPVLDKCHPMQTDTSTRTVSRSSGVSSYF